MSRIKPTEQRTATQPSPELALRVQGLRKRFGGVTAVDDVSFNVNEDEILGLIGPNGSGKTTIFNLVTGELRAEDGQILWHGKDLRGMRPYQICRAGVSRTFQLVRVMPGMTVAENVLLSALFTSGNGSRKEVRHKVDDLLAFVGLGDKRNLPAANLTYVEKKRVELARALAASPRLLLLDEWLSGLTESELEASMELVAQLRESGMSVILVEHVMAAVRALCDRVMVMHAGAKIADGSPDEALSDPTVVQAYLGDEDA